MTIDGYSSDTEFPYAILAGPKTYNAGAKKVPNQGRLIVTKTKTFAPKIMDRKLPEKAPYNWCYAIAMVKSVFDERSLQDNINDYSAIVPTLHATTRMGLLIGCNEQITLSDSSDSDEDATTRERRRAKKLANQPTNDLKCHKFAVLIQRSFWQANWVTRDTGETATISKVRKAYLDFKKKHSKSPKRIKNLKTYERKRSNFPFGAVRSHLYSHPTSTAFFKTMSQRVRYTGKTPPEGSLFIVNQDADYIKLNDAPSYYKLGLKSLTAQTGSKLQMTAQELMSSNMQTPLLDRLDTALQNHREEHSRLPHFYGGAHVYSPDESLESLSQQKGWKTLDVASCKAWTRFGSELGNAMKHLIGHYSPYGLYFHEPFTVISWRGAVDFGAQSEMGDLVRSKLPPNASGARKLAKFDASIVVATSQKRSGGFFTAKYHDNTTLFETCNSNDLKSLQNMPQEIFKAGKWSELVCTVFGSEKPKKACTTKLGSPEEKTKVQWGVKTADARPIIARLYNLYDPHYLAHLLYNFRINQRLRSWDKQKSSNNKEFLKDRSNKKSNRTVFNAEYDNNALRFVLDPENYQCLVRKNTDDHIKEIDLLLALIYNDITAKKIITLAQETGELRRAMFASVIIPPNSTSATLILDEGDLDNLFKE